MSRALAGAKYLTYTSTNHDTGCKLMYAVDLSEDALLQFLTLLVSHSPRPLRIALQGDLGAGKTTFTRLLGESLGIADRITSPSYIGVNGYSLPDGTPFVHADFYRGEAEGAEGVLDEIDTLAGNASDAWVIAEWTSYAPDFEAEADIIILIDSIVDNKRHYTVTSLSDAGYLVVNAIKDHYDA